MQLELAVLVRHSDRHGEAAGGAAVLFAHDDVLGDVHQTTGQVARVRGLQRGVRQALTGTVGRDEVLQHGQALTVGGLDGPRDDLTLRVGHQATDAGDLPDLQPVTTRTGGHHAVDGVQAVHAALHRSGDLVGGLGPDLDELGAALLITDQTQVVLGLDLGGLVLVGVHDGLLVHIRGHVADGDGDARTGGPVEAGVLEIVQSARGGHRGVALGQIVDQSREGALIGHRVLPRVVRRQQLVEQHLAQRGVQSDRSAFLPALRCGDLLGGHEALHGDLHRSVEVQLAQVVGHLSLAHGGEGAACAGLVLAVGGQVVQTDDHILRGQGHRATVRGLQDVVRGQHQDACLGLGLRGQRQVDCHLVTVEVRVERAADQRVQLQGLALHQLRFEGLDAETVQGGCTVQQDGVLGDDLLEHVPDLRTLALHHPLGGLDVLSVVQVDQALHDEGLEQLQSHLLGQTALVQLQLRTDHDDRTARVVDALAEQVLTESSLLALEHVGERLERTVARSGDRTTATAVVEQRVHRLLEHALLVVDDDLRRAQVQQALQAVVAVDHTAVQVVQVGGREAAAVQLHHRADLRRDHRDGVEHHALRRVAGGQEGVEDLQALQGPGLPLALAVGDDLAEVLGLGVHVEVLQALLDRLGAHVALEVLAIAGTQLAEQRLIALQVRDGEALEAIPDLLQLLDLGVGTLADLRHLLISSVAGLPLLRGLGALGLQTLEVVLEVLGDRSDVGVAVVGQDLELLVDLGLQVGQVLVTTLLVHEGDHVGGEVDDLLQVLRRQVKQVAQTGGNTLEVPDVGHRGGQLDVAHAVTADLGTGHLNAAALTDDALEAHALVLAAVALPVAGGTEDLLAEESVLLRLQGAVVDGLRLLDLTVGPAADVVTGGQTDAHRSE